MNNFAIHIGTKALHEAVINRNMEELLAVLGSGVPVDACNEDLNTAAMSAALVGFEAGLRVLVEAGTNLEHKDTFGLTVAMFATENVSTGCLALLIKAGAKLDERDMDGWTVAMFAAREGQIECLHLLAQAGVDLWAIDHLGYDAQCHAHYADDQGATVAWIAAWKESRELSAAVPVDPSPPPHKTLRV